MQRAVDYARPHALFSPQKALGRLEIPSQGCAFFLQCLHPANRPARPLAVSLAAARQARARAQDAPFLGGQSGSPTHSAMPFRVGKARMRSRSVDPWRQRLEPMLAPLASSRGAETHVRSPTVAAPLGAVSSLHWQGALVLVCSRGPLWQRLKCALGPVPLWQRRLEHVLALGRLVLRRRVAPTPGLAFCPRLQRPGFRGRGFLSHAGELDAGSVFGGGRYGLHCREHSLPGSSSPQQKGRVTSSVRYRGPRQCVLGRQRIRQVGYRTQVFQAALEQGKKARK